MVRDNRHDSAYLYGAICPSRGVGAAIIMPAANAEGMNQHLKEISTQVTPGAHAALICDGAGWHQTGDKLQVPDNVTLVPLPAYAPELNPMENVWEYLRANKLCNLVWDTYETIVQAVTAPAVLWFVRDRGTIQGYAVVAHVSHTIAIECCPRSRRSGGPLSARRTEGCVGCQSPRRPLWVVLRRSLSSRDASKPDIRRISGSDRKHSRSWLVCVNQHCIGTAVGIVTGPGKGLGIRR